MTKSFIKCTYDSMVNMRNMLQYSIQKKNWLEKASALDEICLLLIYAPKARENFDNSSLEIVKINTNE